MFEKILVPLDGSSLAEETLLHLRKLLSRGDAELILVCAADPSSAKHAPWIPEARSLGEAGRYLSGIQDRLSEEGLRVSSHARRGAPAKVILNMAQEYKATMIAMASHGRTGLRRLILGGVAQEVLRKSPVPVYVVRPFRSHEGLPRTTAGPDDQFIHTILLPFDGRELASTMVPLVSELADLFESRVVLLSVQEPGAKKREDVAEPSATLGKVSLELEEQGVATLSLIRRGNPAREILEAARMHHADLIAMATHGRSGMSRLVMGSVTEKVLHDAPCPMLIWKPTVSASGRKVVALKCVGR
jgi:nucleotide-binding universal stress UspA family protein